MNVKDANNHISCNDLLDDCVFYAKGSKHYNSVAISRKCGTKSTKFREYMRYCELRAEVSKECCPNSHWPAIHVSTLTTHSLVASSRGGPWSSTPCVLRIDGINIASTSGNNVGAASPFKEILASI